MSVNKPRNNNPKPTRIADDDGATAKLGAMKSGRAQSTVKNREQVSAIATSEARKSGGGAHRTAGRNAVEP